MNRFGLRGHVRGHSKAMLNPIFSWKLMLAFAVVVCIQGVAAMTIFDAGKVCLFSKISGTIVLNGRPVANALVVRKVNLNKDKVDQAATDEKGYFEMPAVFQRTVTKFLPQEFVVKQDITVRYQDKDYDIWSGVKRTPEENAESRGEDLVVFCELTKEKYFKQVNGSPVIGRCTWNAEADQIETGF